MAVTLTVNLPDIPALGQSVYLPLGGDGTTAPMGCYVGEYVLAGDVSGGSASIVVNMDPRYTNLVAFIDGRALSAAAATDFYMEIAPNQDATPANGPRVSIVGTMPHVAFIASGQADFLWYPPPMYYQQEGSIRLIVPNVDSETYSITMECYVFVADIRRLTPIPWLMQSVPGVSAPASI